jgi:flagellin-specific chaperone FliS
MHGKRFHLLRQVRTFVLISALIAVASSCATTINLAAPTTLAQPVVTTLPTGTISELFEQMKLTLSELSLAITNEDKSQAKTMLATVLDIWGALKPQIVAEDGETADQTVEDIQRIVDLASSSVQRTRPADADKALRFLDLVIQSQQ